jgi:hypothetical protein
MRVEREDIKNDNAVQPSSIDAPGGRRARRGGGPHRQEVRKKDLGGTGEEEINLPS